MSVKIFAPAKINLGLEILGKLDNGYHEVDMIMQSISLYDEINVEKSLNSEVIVECSRDIGCPLEKNLAYKAAKIFLKYVGRENLGINIYISKNIPQGAGLAGGSADAAGVLYGLNLLLKTNISQLEMLNLACKIGSDVPFCLMGGCAHATGLGTTLVPISSLREGFIVVVKPDISVCTKDAYDACDKLNINEFKNHKNLIKFLKAGDITGVSENIFNRFEEVLNNNEIFEIKKNLCKNGALGASMSGSGSAVFGLFSDRDEAIECEKNLKKYYSQTFLCKPLNHGVFETNISIT